MKFMNTFLGPRMASRAARAAGCLLLLAVSGRQAGAVLPLPDQIVYGTVAIQNKAVTNSLTSTNILIEARRTSDNQLLASYRMGTSTSQGTFFYVLRVPMEDAPTSSLAVAEPDDSLVITVKKGTAVQFTSTNLALNSGSAVRLDFGASVDANGDGVPDGWETQYFGTTSGNLAGDSDHDGVSDADEYVAGTSPTNGADAFRLNAGLSTNQWLQVSFQTRLASGVGYEGRSRYYALEFRTNVSSLAWNGVTNFSRVLGTNQTVVYQAPLTNSMAAGFYRARVWLEGP